MTECRWVRHAPIYPPGHAPSCYIGQTDLPALLPQENTPIAQLPDDALWFASPLLRAMQTACWLKPSLENLVLVPQLKEQSFGRWEGKDYSEIWQKQEHRHDWSRPESIRPEEGESFADVCARVEGWLEHIIARHPGRTLIIVAHAGSIRAALRHARQLTFSQALALDVPYLSIHTTVLPVIPALSGDLR